MTPHNNSTYTNLGCRCDTCRAAHARECLSAQAVRKARLSADPTLAPHGRASTYGNWGCRCWSCTQAWADDCRSRYARAAK